MSEFQLNFHSGVSCYFIHLTYREIVLSWLFQSRTSTLHSAPFGFTKCLVSAGRQGLLLFLELNCLLLPLTILLGEAGHTGLRHTSLCRMPSSYTRFKSETRWFLRHFSILFLCACSVSYNVILSTDWGISLCSVSWGKVIAFNDPSDTAGRKKSVCLSPSPLFRSEKIICMLSGRVLAMQLSLITHCSQLQNVWTNVFGVMNNK